MSQHSIFTGVVREEDSYTQLLCNLMIRDYEFQRVILNLFSDGKLITDQRLTRDEVRTKKGLGCYGQADMLIRTTEFILILEVKQSLRCAKTKGQIEGAYAKFLTEQDCASKWLVYLVPDGWDKRIKTERDLGATAEQGYIKTRLLTWEELAAKLQHLQIQSFDPAVKEFRDFLAPRFGPITFTKEEIDSMFDANFAEAISKVRGLQIIVDNLEENIRKTFRGRFKTTREKNNDSSEYGFYVQHGSEIILWVGIWTDVVREIQAPISFGFRDCWESAKNFQRLKGDEIDGSSRFALVSEDWSIYKIPHEFFQQNGPSGDLERKIWNLLRPVIEVLA